MTNNTFSSVKEALMSGILDSDRLRNPPDRRRMSKAFSERLFSGRRNSIHKADTRSAFGGESGFITIEGICLSDSPPAQELDLTSMTDEEIKKLKEEDPFMYFSIPEIHQRAYKFEEEDEENEEEEEMMVTANVATPPSPQGPEEEPGVRRAARRSSVASTAAGAGASSPAAASRRLSLPSVASSCPAGMLANADIIRAQLNQAKQQQSRRTLNRSESVVKCRRLSVEAHPTLVCDELMRRRSSIFSASSMSTTQGGEEDMDAGERLLDSMLFSAAGGYEMSDSDDDSDDDEF